MAEKKSSPKKTTAAKKTTSKSSSSKPAPKKKAPPPPPPPALLPLRKAMEAAREEVFASNRYLRRVQSMVASGTSPNAAIQDAQERLAKTRLAYWEAYEKFHKEKAAQSR